jgi:hypothetical protein
MRVPDMMLDSVAYLCVKNANGTVVPAGTGFFLSVKSETVSRSGTATSSQPGIA